MRERVLLFDVDGTLITSGGAGSRALRRAFEELYGWPDALAGLSLAGRTDPWILGEAMRRQGLAEARVAREMPRVLARYLDRLDDELARLDEGGACAGVEALLDRLEQHAPHSAIGLLTGNVAPGAQRKLARFGLWERFGFGAYGDDAPTRPDLLPVALARAAAHRGRASAPAQAVVIGDTPRDVEVARAHGARALAVATGPYSVDALREAGADLVLASLADLERAFAFLVDDAP